MDKRRGLDDACDIVLSRPRVRSPVTNDSQQSPRPLDLPDLSATAPASAVVKPLPLPGSSGAIQAESARLANGLCHVPRPRNPFILFCCDLVHQRKALPRSDLDDTNIPRIAGELWREMTTAQRKPWVELAALEEARHAFLYPDYGHAPVHSGSKSEQTKNDSAYMEERPQRQVPRLGAASPSDHPRPRCQPGHPQPYPQCMLRRRSSSCPPVGAVPVPSHSLLEGWVLTSTRDDMQHRPSRTIMYQSVTPQSVVEPIAPMSAGYNSLLLLQGLEWLSFPKADPLLLNPACALPHLNKSPEPYAESSCGFFHHEPTFSANTVNPGFTLQELKDMEHLEIETIFTDPFSTSVTIPADNDSPDVFSTAISPFDCSGYSTGSPSSPPSGTLRVSSN